MKIKGVIKMKIIKDKIRIKLTLEEEKAFYKVLSVFEIIGEDEVANKFCEEKTDGISARKLWDILNMFFMECE